MTGTEQFMFGTEGVRWQKWATASRSGASRSERLSELRRSAQIFQQPGAFHGDAVSLVVKGECGACFGCGGASTTRFLDLADCDCLDDDLIEQKLLCPSASHARAFGPVGLSQVFVKFHEPGRLQATVVSACLHCSREGNAIPERRGKPGDEFVLRTQRCCAHPRVKLYSFKFKFRPDRDESPTSVLWDAPPPPSTLAPSATPGFFGRKPFAAFARKAKRLAHGSCATLTDRAPEALVRPMGFGAGGIVKGSPAAFAMSVEWRCGGGTGGKMEHGGLTASLQSVGATGAVGCQAAHAINRALQTQGVFLLQ